MEPLVEIAGTIRFAAAADRQAWLEAVIDAEDHVDELTGWFDDPGEVDGRVVGAVLRRFVARGGQVGHDDGACWLAGHPSIDAANDRELVAAALTAAAHGGVGAVRFDDATVQLRRGAAKLRDGGGAREAREAQARLLERDAPDTRRESPPPPAKGRAAAEATDGALALVRLRKPPVRVRPNLVASAAQVKRKPALAAFQADAWLEPLLAKRAQAFRGPAGRMLLVRPERRDPSRCAPHLVTSGEVRPIEAPSMSWPFPHAFTEDGRALFLSYPDEILRVDLETLEARRHLAVTRRVTMYAPDLEVIGDRLIVAGESALEVVDPGGQLVTSFAWKAGQCVTRVGPRALVAGAEQGSGLFAIDGGRVVRAAWFAELTVLDAWLDERGFVVAARSTLRDRTGPTPRADVFELVGSAAALDAALAGDGAPPTALRRDEPRVAVERRAAT